MPGSENYRASGYFVNTIYFGKIQKDFSRKTHDYTNTKLLPRKPKKKSLHLIIIYSLQNIFDLSSLNTWIKILER